MPHRVYLYNCPTIAKIAEGEMLLEVGYNLPLFFAPLLASKAVFAPTHCNSETGSKDGVFSNRDAGVAQLKQFYSFIENNIDWISRPEEFLNAKSHIFDYLDYYCPHAFFELDATDVFSMDDIDYDIQAKDFYADIQHFNSGVLKAIEQNDANAFGKAFSESIARYGFSDFKDYLNCEKYGYGWELLQKDFYDSGEKGEFYFKNKKWGLKGAKNTIVLDPEFDQVWEFQEDLEVATVVKNGKQGVLNRSGELIIPCEYDKIFDFDKDSKIAVVENGNLFGCIDLNNDIVIPILYDDASGFTSIVFLKKNDLYGIYNRNHEPLTDFDLNDFDFEWFDFFEESENEFINRYFQIQINKKWGVYDAKDNRYVVEPIFDEKLDFQMYSSDFGLFVIKAVDDTGKKIGFNSDFSIIELGLNAKISSFYVVGSNLLIIVKNESLFGLYNLTKKLWECESIYSQIIHKKSFNHEYSPQNEIVFHVFIDEKQTFLHIVEYEKQGVEDIGMISFRSEELKHQNVELIDVLTNWKENTVEYEYVFRFKEKNNYGLFVFSDRIIIPVLNAEYRTITNFTGSRDGLFSYVKDKKLGLISVKESVQIAPPIFDYLNKETGLFFSDSKIFKFHKREVKGFEFQPFSQIYQSLDLSFWKDHQILPKKWQQIIDDQLIAMYGISNDLEFVISKYCSDSDKIKRISLLLNDTEPEDLEFRNCYA